MLERNLKSHECRLVKGSSWIKSDIQYEIEFTKEREITFTQRNLVVALYIIDLLAIQQKSLD